MARIPDVELERLKREVSLARLIEGQGLTLTSQGKDLACRCPWHEGDDTPSCIVSPTTNLWHCFGCDAGGSVIDWVMRTHRVSFRHACELLAKEHPALAGPVVGTMAAIGPAKLSAGKLRTAQSFSLADGDQVLLNQVIDFYHTTLKASPEALKYLESRGLGSLELIERFKLGYANRTLAYRLAPKQYKAGAELRSALQRVGILRDSGHEHLNGSIVVPLFGEREGGSPAPVVGAYGRKVLDNLRAGTPKHLYLPGPHRGVFNREGLDGQPEIILCEALIDALTFWAAGYRHVTSCYGVNGCTDELLAALRACGAQRILLAFDRDEAGDRGAEALAKRLTAEGLDCFRLLFPKGMDANEYARSVKPAEKSLGVVIRSAQWLDQGTKPALTPPAVAPRDRRIDRVRDAAGAQPDESVSPLLPLAASAGAVADASVVAELSPALAEPPAAALPAPPEAQPEAQADGGQIMVAFGERRYRVRGLPAQLTDVLKVNVLVTVVSDPLSASSEGALHVDTLDLYQAKQRQVFAKCAAPELGVEESVIQRDLGRLLLKLEQVIEERAKAAESPVAPPAAMTTAQTEAALEFLRDDNLIERIMADVERVGLVGEPSNALMAYLACISRKLSAPLAVLIQSTRRSSPNACSTAMCCAPRSASLAVNSEAVAA
jgi:DNA primase catalytic core